MGVPNNPEKVHERNLVLSNIWSGGSHTIRDKLVQCSGFRIQPRQEFGVDAETVELVEGAPRIDDHTGGKISAKTCLKIQQGCKEKGICSGRSSTSEGSGEYTRCQCRKVSTNLGGTL